MIIVKITLLLIASWIICKSLVNSYLIKNFDEAVKVQFTQYRPWYLVINSILKLGTILGIIASIVYLLFFR